MAKTTVYLIGAPTDVGASDRGASMGPEALRVAGLPEALRARGVHVQDQGNLVGPVNPWTAPKGGYRHLAEVTQWNQAVYDGVRTALKANALPILMGGDHCLAIGSIAAVKAHCVAHKKSLRVLWFDAHTDFNTNRITPSGNIHGMPVAMLCGWGPKQLTSGFNAAAGKLNPAEKVKPILNVTEIIQIGIRSVDDEEKRFVHQKGLEVFDMRSIDELGMRAVMDAALRGLDANTHLHVSFDVDFLDPDIAPGVGTAVAGGPTYREAQLCMEMIADTGRLRSLDIMELNPACDVRNRTGKLAVDLVESLFGKSTLMRRPSK
jgi:arginase